MGEAKRKQQYRNGEKAGDHRKPIELYMLPPTAAINGARIRELTHDDEIPFDDSTQIILKAYRAKVEGRSFYVGFCLGGETEFSAIGFAVIERLLMEAPNASLYVSPIIHHDIAWDMVLRHLGNFTHQILLFTFPNSDVYDAGTAEMHFSSAVQVFGPDGEQLKKLTAAQRRKILEEKARLHNESPPPKVYTAPDSWGSEDIPWIFRVVTPGGKEIRTAVWNGRRDYVHQLSTDVIRWVGGEKIAIVQVDRPVGVNLRSSLMLTNTLAVEFDGVIHWARDTETFQSILKSFIRLNLQSLSPPELPEGWRPEITLLPANSGISSEV